MILTSVSRSLSHSLWMSPNTWHSWLRYSWTGYYLRYLYITCVLPLLPGCPEAVKEKHPNTETNSELFIYYCPPTQLWKVMFSAVCLSVHRVGECPHHTGPQPSLVQGRGLCFPLYSVPPQLQTCSNLFIMKHVQSASGHLAPHWNAVLFTVLCDLCLLSLTK